MTTSPEICRRRNKEHSMFERHHTQETKDKMSKAHKEQIPWNKGLKGYNSGKKNPMFGMCGEKHWNFGKHWDKKVRQKISDSLKWLVGENNPRFGKHLSKETKEKIGIANSGKLLGERNPMWRGGISHLPYPFVFNKELKRLIRRRDGNQCRNPKCEGIFSFLTPHHINYNKNDCRPLNLITLCNVCNSKANYHREEWKRLYHKIVSRLSTKHFTRMNYLWGSKWNQAL